MSFCEDGEAASLAILITGSEQRAAWRSWCSERIQRFIFEDIRYRLMDFLPFLFLSSSVSKYIYLPCLPKLCEEGREGLCSIQRSFLALSVETSANLIWLDASDALYRIES